MVAFNKKEYDKNFNKEKTKMIGIRFHLHNEKDMIDFLETRKPYSDYIKKLIKKDMKENQEK